MGRIITNRSCTKLKDPKFIQKMLQKGNEARGKAIAEFNHLSFTQLNWKTGEECWSIGQCLDHLIISDCLYFPVFKKIASGKFEMSFWENWSPFGGLFGKMLTNQIQENLKKKLNAPKVFEPPASKIDAVILERFYKHLDTLLDYTNSCSHVDIDKIHITSPALKLVTFSLRNAIAILIQHEHRHINQALKLKQEKDFPPE